ncbi:MAG TPA: hypothetical protein VNZ52_04770 [Candidatus Thermoplasmatota archaeon]|nr:hypothetical protein [Candidatus Thermoplasmatota archaeon]
MATKVYCYAILGCFVAMSFVTVAGADAIHDTLNGTVSTSQSTPEILSATDVYASFITDSCVNRGGFGLALLGTEETTTDLLVANPGESVTVTLAYTGEPEVVYYNSAMAADLLITNQLCCVCGVQDPTRPIGCQAFGSICCCQADISTDLKTIKCYCQGGAGCKF